MFRKLESLPTAGAISVEWAGSACYGNTCGTAQFAIPGIERNAQPSDARRRRRLGCGPMLVSLPQMRAAQT